MTTSGLKAKIASHMRFTSSSSIWSIRFQWSSWVTSIFVCDSPFLYSSGQSRRMILGFSILRRIFGCVISLLIITPSITSLFSISPPGIFSIRAYRLMSTSRFPPPTSKETVLTAFKARLHISSDHLETNLVPIDDWMSLYMALSFSTSTGIDISSTIASASVSARLKAEMMVTGWMFRSR